MKFERLPAKAIIIWELLAALLFAALFSLTLFLLIPGTWLWYTLLWVLGALCVLTTFLYLPLYYTSIEFGANSKVLVYRKGVIFPKTEILYRDRIAFVTVYHNPLTPVLQLSTLTVRAAGGTLRILFMSTKRAEALAAQLARV